MKYRHKTNTDLLKCTVPAARRDTVSALFNQKVPLANQLVD